MMDAFVAWLSGVIGPLFGLATMGVVVLTQLRLGWRHPASRVALMLLTFWALAQFLGPEFDPLMDVAGFYTALTIWFERRGRDWAFIVAGLFGLQLITHYFFQDGNGVLRQAVLNAVFGLMLLTTSEPCAPESLRRSVRGVLGFGPPRRAPRVARNR